jgi:hypothetical protein
MELNVPDFIRFLFIVHQTILIGTSFDQRHRGTHTLWCVLSIIPIIVQGVVNLKKHLLIIYLGDLWIIYAHVESKPLQKVISKSRKIQRTHVHRFAPRHRKELIASVIITVIVNSMIIETFIGLPYGWLFNVALAITTFCPPLNKFRFKLIVEPTGEIKTIELLYMDEGGVTFGKVSSGISSIVLVLMLLLFIYCVNSNGTVLFFFLLNKSFFHQIINTIIYMLLFSFKWKLKRMEQCHSRVKKDGKNAWM